MLITACRHIILSVIIAFLIGGCTSRKHYTRKDYPFYSENFQLDSTSLLKTDGVYSNGKKVYKFYRSGQVNMVLSGTTELKKDDDYAMAFNRGIREAAGVKKATLFEGYYHIKDNRMVMQFVNTATRQFYYTYVLLEKGKLAIVKSTHLGKGKIKDQHYQSSYKDVYRFEPKPAGGYLAPDW
jgi:hypothetical protein